MSLGGAGRSVWAKSLPVSGGPLVGWLPLHVHLDDTQGVAGLLIDHWIPRQVLDRIASDLPWGAGAVRPLATWLAAVHDVGKASPAFAVQVPILADHMRRNGLSFNPMLAKDPARSKVTHALVGHLAVRTWLNKRFGVPPREGGQFAAVIGGHHGVPPESTQLVQAMERTDLAGDGAWIVVRNEILDRAAERCGVLAFLGTCRGVKLSQCAQVLLSAVVIVADWIASDTELFPPWPVHDADVVVRDGDEGSDRVATAWSLLDLPPQWCAEAPGAIDVDRMFAERFGLNGAQARPVQVAAVEVAAAQVRPGMIVIEAPMGEGKTEAALLAAELLGAASGAGGCFVALPTQATSDAMFARVRSWLATLPGTADVQSVFLAHGKNSLNDDYQGLPCRKLGSIGTDEPVDAGHASCAQIAHAWLRGRKKGVLASFVVGTIDQVLFAGLKSRHLALRHLALAGKVVILDEVHSYDVYMSQYLDRVLHWLGAYGVPVIVLSATLPARRRAELLTAYDSVTGSETAAVPDSVKSDYPLVVATEPTGGRVHRVVAGSLRRTEVCLDHLTDSDDLVGYVRSKLVEGGCALVVRNTVARVQETARLLEAAFGLDCVTVHHSRFLACDRARTDRWLLERFGPPPSPTRPARHIVVGSQVVEQSLDIDFDLVVTDLAPVDLVLQRMGRLHRHERPAGRPARLRQARCAISGVEDWEADPVRAAAGSTRVYEPHTLLRAAALLRPQERLSVCLPADISPLVQRAYGDGELGPSSWQEVMLEARRSARLKAEQRAERAGHFRLGRLQAPGTSLVGWLRAGVGDADDSATGAAQVRDSEESLEVLVVQSDIDGGLLTPEWIERGAGVQIPLDQSVPERLARVIAACSLRLPPALSNNRMADDVIRALEANQFDSFRQHRLLKGELVLFLGPDRTAVLRSGRANFQLTYDLRRGLQHDTV